ncbi:MAG: hypothetical protein OCC49_00945 [Fibrobacterales bacterium]
MHILLIGIPTEETLDTIFSNHADCSTLYVTETRPFEKDVSDAIQNYGEHNISLTLITDNMIGSLFQNREISALYIQGHKKTDTEWNTLPGSAIGLLFSKQLNIPAYTIPIDTSNIPDQTFFDCDIIPTNVTTIAFKYDLIPEKDIMLPNLTSQLISENSQ